MQKKWYNISTKQISNMNYLGQFLKITIVELVLGVLYFPIWWYTGGLVIVAGKTWNNVRDANNQLAWTLLGRYLFTPMYGDYTRSGRAISFFIRLIWYALITVLMLIVLLVNVVMVLGWLALLPATLVFIIRNAI
jgi:hypothetical protein